MTNLFLVTEEDASPALYLRAAQVDVVEILLAMRHMEHHDSPGLAAVLFLRSLSPAAFEQLAPSIHSHPIAHEADAWEAAESEESMLVWNIKQWRETSAFDW